MTDVAVTMPEPGILAERTAAQLLLGAPARTAEEVAGRLLAIQGQDPRGARLAVRARSHGLSAADIDRALTVDRSLVISWLNRGTLHLVRSEDYWPLHQLTTPQLATGCARRLGQEGVSADAADRGVAVIEAALARNGPQTRAQLAEQVSAAGIRTHGQAMVHLFFLASLRGLVVRGPMSGKQHAYVLARDWLGAPPGRPAADREAALGWLARRYLAGHSPATEWDLAKWAGLPLRDARRGLREIAASLVVGEDGLVRLGRPAGGAVLAGDARPAARPAAGPDPAFPPPRLLGPFDPLLHGWQSRTAVLGRHEPDIVRGGMFRSFALVGGRAAGTWGLSGDRVSLTLLDQVSAADRRALDADAEDVRRFLGLARPAG